MQKTIHLEKPKKAVAVVKQKTGLPTSATQRPSPKFVYVHYPTAWDFDAKRGFIPALSKIIAKPGVNGVDDRMDLTKAIAGHTAQGGVYIDPKDQRLGDYTDYVRYYDTQDGGKWYVDFCQTATVLPTGEIIWSSDTLDEYRDFLKAIRESGIIEPMIYEVYVKAVEDKKKAIDRLYGRLDRNPHLKARVEAAEAELAAMEKWWSKQSRALAKKAAKAAPLKSEVADA